MTNSPQLDRTKVTFEQAEGREPMPRQLLPGEMSQELRSYLWHVMYETLEGATEYSNIGYGGADPWLKEPWKRILKAYWISHLHRFADEFTSDARTWRTQLGQLFKATDYVSVFGFLQFVIRRAETPQSFAANIEGALDKANAAYRLVDQTIMPVASEEHALAIERAFAELQKMEFGGARAHLREAGAKLTIGDWAGSIRESVHAVESLVVSASNKGSTLGEALKNLDRRGAVNPNLRKAMNALYDYSSDEKGIRHARAFEGVNVDEADALYMFGACAAFVTYITTKLRSGTFIVEGR